ncbi:MAG: hypothetical protein IPP14_07410 [Planctomycetes bacterium]|nr:hypothetical protein [Planctomycetota bacterium]
MTESDTTSERSSMDDVIDIYKRDVDRTLLREHLKMTVEQRFERFLALMKFLEELRAAGKSARTHQ